MLVYFSFYFLSGNDPHFRGAGRVTRGWENTGGGKWPGAEASSGIAGEKKNYRTQVQLLQCIVYPCQQLNWLTDYCADSCLVDLTDVTVAFEYANSKLLDLVSVADVDAMERDDDSLVNILKLRFGRDFEAGVWWRILKLNFGQVKLKLGHNFGINVWLSFEAYVWSRIWG